MMLEAEKHVLCEKPLGVTASEVKEMSKLAKSKEKFLMEVNITTWLFRDATQINGKSRIGFIRFFRDPYGYSKIENRVPRIEKNCIKYLFGREGLQVNFGLLMFS